MSNISNSNSNSRNTAQSNRSHNGGYESNKSVSKSNNNNNNEVKQPQPKRKKQSTESSQQRILKSLKKMKNYENSHRPYFSNSKGFRFPKNVIPNLPNQFKTVENYNKITERNRYKERQRRILVKYGLLPNNTSNNAFNSIRRALEKLKLENVKKEAKGYQIKISRKKKDTLIKEIVGKIKNMTV